MIFNLINGKIYIGQTQNLNRWKEHLYIADNSTYAKHKLIHKAIAKYGKNNFTFTIIQYNAHIRSLPHFLSSVLPLHSHRQY